jgi:tape measure domain-containing protein
MATFDHKIVIAVDSKKAATSLKEVERSSQKAGQSFEKMGKQAKKSGKETETSFSKAAAAARKLAIAAISLEAARRGIVALVRAADTMRVVEARVGLFGETIGDVSLNLERLEEISRNTFTSLQGNAQLFARFSQATESLGTTGAEVAGIVEALNQSFIVSGATAQEASSATLQLSQAFGAGALRGEEFRSIQESNLTLLKLIADEMGVETGALKELAAEGKITADIIQRALLGNLEKLRSQAGEIPITFERGVKNLDTATTKLLANLDKVLGVSATLSAIIQGLANAINALAAGPEIPVFESIEEGNVILADLENQIKTTISLFSQMTNEVERNNAERKALANIIPVYSAVIARQQELYDQEKKQAELRDKEAEKFRNRFIGDEKQQALFDKRIRSIDEENVALDKRIALIGLEGAAREEMAILLDEEAEIRRLDRMREAGDLTGRQVAAEKALLTELTKKQFTLLELKTAAEESKKVQEEWTGAVEDWGNSFTDQLIEGRLNFKNFAEGILKDLTKMIVKQMVFNQLAGMATDIGENIGRFFSGTPAPGSNGIQNPNTGGSDIDFNFGGFNAKGNAFSNGNVIPFARGGVVNKPTVFPMAKGVGLMGEAGAEAIMPLKRTSGGDLGVKADGMGTTVIINNNTKEQAEVRESNGPNGKMIEVMIGETVKGMFGSGAMDRTMSANYGLTRQGR